MSEQQYMAPVNYFVPTKSEAAELQKEAGALRATVDNLDNPWVERTRAEQQLKAVETRLQAFRREGQQTTVGHTSPEATQRRVKEAAAAVEKARAAAGLETLHTDLPRSPFQVNNSEGRWVQADGGGGWLWIPWDAKQKAANLAAQRPKVEEQMYAATVPYFAAR